MLRMRRDRDWCKDSGKKCYPTKKAALSAASSTGKSRGVELKIYKCPDCKDYHLTRASRKFTEVRLDADY